MSKVHEWLIEACCVLVAAGLLLYGILGFLCQVAWIGLKALGNGLVNTLADCAKDLE